MQNRRLLVRHPRIPALSFRPRGGGCFPESTSQVVSTVNGNAEETAIIQH
ncbi:MAG: hypothetical protein R2757_17630 [Draconibacterium sp.]